MLQIKEKICTNFCCPCDPLEGTPFGRKQTVKGTSRTEVSRILFLWVINLSIKNSTLYATPIYIRLTVPRPLRLFHVGSHTFLILCLKVGRSSLSKGLTFDRALLEGERIVREPWWVHIYIRAVYVHINIDNVNFYNHFSHIRLQSIFDPTLHV